MRLITFLALNLALVAGGLAAYDALRNPAQRQAPARELETLRGRLDLLEQRVAGLARSVGEVESASAAQDAEPERGDARLHGREALAFDEDALQRTGEALATLRSDQLQQDERRYVLRRLRELDVDLDPDEEFAATRIVLAYFREMSATWRKLRVNPRDPVTAEGLYEDVTRRHHAALAKVVPDARQARVIASALMPLR